jgi:macrolide transport system ATP-binding/permease protein
METLLQDVRYGLRVLRSAPGFTAIATLILALGIGANTVVFSILNTLFFRPAPVGHALKLVVSSETRRGISPAEYSFDREHNHSFSGLAAEYVTAHTFLAGAGEPRMVLGALVSANYFDLLEMKPFLGRYFVAEEDAPAGRAPVAVLSYAVWQSAFGADREVLGRTIRLNSVATTIVGVAPAEFHGLHAGIDNDLWIPTSGASVLSRASGCGKVEQCGIFISLVGRLSPGHGLENAQEEMNNLSRQWENIYPDLRKSTFRFSPARGLYPMERKEIAQAARLLPASVFVLLLIASANLAGLLLARGTSRAREIAVRLALGASRMRIVRQLLTESALLALLGSSLGLLLLVGSEGWLSRFPFVGSEGFRSYYDVSLNPTMLVATLLLAFVTVFLFGLAPAWRSSTPSPMEALKSGETAGAHQPRLGNLLVGGQIALALVLAAGALLLMKSLERVLMGPGFDPGHIAIVRVSPYRLGLSPAQSLEIQREALRRVAAVPGVQSVSFGERRPWWRGDEDWISLPGRDGVREETRIQVHFNTVAPGFFKTLQIPLLRGREFNVDDRPETPKVVIVNEFLAGRMWPAKEAVGKSLLVGGVERTVVGVAAAAQYNAASDQPQLFFYLPYWQVRNGGDARFFVRTSSDPGAAIPEIKAAIHGINQDVPLGEDSTMLEGLLSDFGPLRLTRAVLIFAGSAAVFLSAIGLYGVLAFAVVRRTREIGIRMALGATRESVRNLFVTQGIKLALAGTLAGALAAAASMRLLASLLYGVRPFEPVVFGSLWLVVVAVCLVASYIPARRATKVDPMVALRYE